MANYPYKKVGVQLDKIRNDVNENFVAVENDFKEAKVTNDNLQTQVNTLVVSGDSSPQAQQASVGADGTNYNGNLKARLDSEYNNVTAQLATIEDNKAAIRDGFRSALDFITGGSLIIIGDSISAGYGLPYSGQYVSKLFDVIKNFNRYPNDMETIINFQEDSTLTLVGTSFGVKGACKKSLIMPINSTVSFVGNFNYVDIMFDRTTTSGSIEVYKDDILYKTIDCSGTEDSYATSFPSAVNNTGEGTYTLKCINAQVELTGLIRLQARNDKEAIYLIRCAVSGEDTSYFSDDNTLNYLKHVADYVPTKNKAYLLALGTNDIYNPSKAKTALQFRTNVEKIITNLYESDNDVRIILTVPPIANTNIFPYTQDIHPKYRNEIIDLAHKYDCSVVDYSFLDFISNDWYQDGLHSNWNGTDAMLIHIMTSLSYNIQKTKMNSNLPITLQNNWQWVGFDFRTPYVKLTEKTVKMTGVISGGIKTSNTTLLILPDECKPNKNLLILVSTELGFTKIQVGLDGNVTIPNAITDDSTWISLDGVIYDIE